MEAVVRSHAWTLVLTACTSAGDPSAREADVAARVAEHLATEVEYVSTRDGIGGTYVRFRARSGELPVLGSDAVAIVDGRGVQAVFGRRVVLPALPAADIGEDAAIAIAEAAAGVPHARVERGIDPAHGVVYRVELPTHHGPAWDIGVVAADGSLGWRRDLNWYVDGTGLVFDANPVASTGDATLVDNDDATTAALDAARVRVSLPRLDGSGFLRGMWVDARGAQTRTMQPGQVFDFTRADPGFLETMAYYHIDRVQDRLQSLGFTGARGIAARPQSVVVDALASDESFFSPVTRELLLGTGGVDDAEDADIIIHEYGHALQDDVVPGFGTSADARAIGEGFADYFAASSSDVLATAASHPQVGDAACLADWDATAYAPPCLRRVDRDKHYPEATTGEPHEDGEIWSASLWRARAVIGADMMDRVVIESNFMLAGDTSITAAADAVVLAERMISSGEHAIAIRRALYHHGVLRSPRPAIPDAELVAAMQLDLRNPAYTDNLDDTQTTTFPGATSVRLHFASIDTETATGCLDGGCDNIYLFDGAGDLYQILHGTHTDLTSVAIPGDTVRIRLVTNGGGSAHAGYVVDRIDSVQPSDTPPDDADTGGCCNASAPDTSLLLGLLALRRRRRRHQRVSIVAKVGV